MGYATEPTELQILNLRRCINGYWVHSYLFWKTSGGTDDDNRLIASEE